MKIIYTSGTITTIDNIFWTLRLFNSGVRVYAATLDEEAAVSYLNNPKIKKA